MDTCPDKTVGEEAFILFAVILRHRPCDDLPLLTQPLEDIFRVAAVFWTVSRIKAIKGDVKVGKIVLMLFVVAANELFRGNPRPPGIHFDGRAMGIIRAHVDDVLPCHFEEAHKDIRLDVFDEMTQVDTAVSIRQRAGNESRGRHGSPSQSSTCMQCVILVTLPRRAYETGL